MKFRILVGKHAQKEPAYHDDGSPVLDAHGNHVKVIKVYEGRRPGKDQGDVIRSDVDLVAKFNIEPTHRKFERLEDDVRATPGRAMTTPRLESQPQPAPQPAPPSGEKGAPPPSTQAPSSGTSSATGAGGEGKGGRGGR